MIKRRKIRLRRKKGETSVLWHMLYGALAIICVVVMCVGIWYVTRLSVFTIDSITIEGGETISHEDVRYDVESELRGNYLLLVPHRFIYLYPYDRIMERLEEIPKIHDISVRRSKRELIITFSEYIPHALWCLSQSATDCYYISEEGFAFVRAPALSGNALVRFVFEEETELTEKQVIERDQLRDVNTFIDVLSRELGFRIGGVTYTEAGDIIYHVNGGGEFLTASDIGVDKTYENLKSVLDSDEFGHLQPGSFQYIDLRFGNKVFVNEELVSPAEATTTEDVLDIATEAFEGVTEEEPR